MVNEKFIVRRCENGGTCIDGVDGYTCTCPKGLTGQSCECEFLDDSTANCTGVITPFHTSGGGNNTEEPRTSDTSVSSIPVSDVNVDTVSPWTEDNWYPTFTTTFRTSPSDDAFTTGFSIFSSTVTMPFDRTTGPVTYTELTTPDRYTAVYTMDTAEITDSAGALDTTVPNRSPVTGYTDTEDTAVTDYGTTDTSYHKPDTTTTMVQRGMGENTATLSTRSRSTTTTAMSRRPTFEADTTDPPRTKKTTTTTTTNPTYKSTINYYPQSVGTEPDFTTFYDENNMSTDFDYNFTSFAVPVTDRVPTAIDKSCANVLCLNGGRCEQSKTGHKVSF